jgi:hypothetical protein
MYCADVDSLHVLLAGQQAAATFVIFNGTATSSTPATPTTSTPAADSASDTAGADGALLQGGQASADAAAAQGQLLVASEPQNLAVNGVAAPWQALGPIVQQLAAVTRHVTELEERLRRVEASKRSELHGAPPEAHVRLRDFNPHTSICKTWSLKDFSDIFNNYSAITPSKLVDKLLKKTFFNAQDTAGHNIRKTAKYTESIEVYSQGGWQTRPTEEVVSEIMKHWGHAQAAAAAQLYNRGLVSDLSIERFCCSAGWMSPYSTIDRFIEEAGIKADLIAEPFGKKAVKAEEKRLTAFNEALTCLTKQVKKNGGAGFVITPALPWPSRSLAAPTGKFWHAVIIWRSNDVKHMLAS